VMKGAGMQELGPEDCTALLAWTMGRAEGGGG
jgi:hypothetical protein